MCIGMTAILATDVDGKTYIYMTDSTDNIYRVNGVWNWRKEAPKGQCACIDDKSQMRLIFGVFHEYVSEQLESIPIPSEYDDPLEIDINFKTSINYF